MGLTEGLDPITRDELVRLSKLYPGYAIVGEEFLGGTESQCGLVPPDWNGKTLYFTRKK